MSPTPVAWTDEVDDVIRGDLTAAVAYPTDAQGAVVTGVAPCGLARRDDGVVGFTTSLGFGRKLDRITRNPHIAMAYHSREHGDSTSASYVLVQGMASVDLQPSQERLETFIPLAAHYLGEVRRGVVWDRLLHEYYFERVFVDVHVVRITVWPHLAAIGEPQVIGAPRGPAPSPQAQPVRGTEPRVQVDRVAGAVAALPHRLLAYVDGDGFPVILPVEIAGHDDNGLRLVDHSLSLPAGGRRAGFLAHSYRPHLVGLSTRTCTGWLDVRDDGSVVYAPHTSKGFYAPPAKTLLLVSNGLAAKYGMWQARRHGVERGLLANR